MEKLEHSHRRKSPVETERSHSQRKKSHVSRVSRVSHVSHAERLEPPRSILSKTPTISSEKSQASAPVVKHQKKSVEKQLAPTKKRTLSKEPSEKPQLEPSTVQELVLEPSLELMKKRSQMENRVYLQPFLNKKYAMWHCDGNIDAVMKMMGVGLARRTMFRCAMQKMELTEQDGVYTLSVNFAFRVQKTVFRIGVEFDDETPTKVKVRSIFYQDKSKLTQMMKVNPTRTIVITREFQLQPEQVVVTVQLENVVARRVYKPFSRLA